MIPQINIGERKISSKRLKTSNQKSSHKILSPIAPKTNIKNLFPKDFFDTPNQMKFQPCKLSTKKKNSDNLNMNEKKKNELNNENILYKISCKIDSSTNSHSTNNTESGNFNSKEIQKKNIINEKIEIIDEDEFKETPYFFPKINENEISKKIISDNFKLKSNLMDSDKVNKEIKTLFDNIPENLKSDPDINEKVGMLLKNIYEMKEIIKNKKDEICSPISHRNCKSNKMIYNRPYSSNKLLSKGNNKNIKGNSRYVKV